MNLQGFEELFLGWIDKIIIGTIAVVLGWLGKTRLSKKTQRAEITKQIQDIYGQMVEDTNQEILEMRKRVKNLQDERLRDREFFELKLQEVEAGWKKKYQSLQAKYSRLKTEFDALKQRNDEGYPDK